MILDTSALSAVADNVSAVVQVFVNADTVELPVIVLGEYRFGIAQSLRRDNYEQWLTKLIASSRVLDINEHTTRNYAHVRLELKKLGRPIPSNDLWIAALSRQHSQPILSRDRHFESNAHEYVVRREVDAGYPSRPGPEAKTKWADNLAHSFQADL